MKIIKLGIVLWSGFILVGCTPTKVGELTDATIQEDAHSCTKFDDKIESIQEFKISSDTTQDKTRVIIGKLTAVTTQVTITGYFKLTYEVIGNQWTIKFGSFDPIRYTDIDPSLTPNDDQIRNDLEHLTNLPSDLIRIDTITYTLEYPTNIDLIVRAKVSMTTEKGKISATVVLTYYFQDFQWNLGTNSVTLDSITDITLLPDEQDILDLAGSIFPDPKGIIYGDPFQVVSSKLDKEKGIVVSVIHIDSGSNHPVRITGDITITGTMDIEQGWVYEITEGTMSKAFTATGNYHMVWDTVSADENQVSKGDSVDLVLSGRSASVVVFTEDVDEIISTITGTITLKGVKYQIIGYEPGMDPVYGNYQVGLRYGTEDNEILYFCYGPIEDNGLPTYYVLTGELSYAFIPN